MSTTSSNFIFGKNEPYHIQIFYKMMYSKIRVYKNIYLDKNVVLFRFCNQSTMFAMYFIDSGMSPRSTACNAWHFILRRLGLLSLHCNLIFIILKPYTRRISFCVAASACESYLTMSAMCVIFT